MPIDCHILADRTGIGFHDSVGDRRVHIHTDRVPDFDVDEPIGDHGTRIHHLRCTRLRFPEIPTGHVHRADGTLLHPVGPDIDTTFEDGSYRIELHASLRLELHLEGPVRLTTVGERLEIAHGEQDVSIAARRYHGTSETRITTTDDPVDILRAISRFGAAVRTSTVERSFPTLRDHPPLLLRGHALHIPDGLAAPRTDIRLEIPPTYRAAFAAAPVAYYLGAECRPSDIPRLVAGDAFTCELSTRHLHRSLGRLLQRIFLLDTVVRTEGIYQVPITERDIIEPHFDRPLSELYRATPSERLDAYTAVPAEAIDQALPQWSVTATVPAAPESIGLLSHLAYRLAVVRPMEPSKQGSDQDLQTRLLRRAYEESTGVQEAVSPERPSGSDTLEHVWFGDSLPCERSVCVKAAYQHADSAPSSTESIDVAVAVGAGKVGTDEAAGVRTAYVETAYLPFEVELLQNPSCRELETAFCQTREFLYYIGHIDADGLRCRDGHLELRELERVGPAAFFLNACDSIAEGKALIERGSAGGIVTVGDVIDEGAGRLGMTIARLLDRGFPLLPAFRIACTQHFTGVNYSVIGDGSIDVRQAPHGAPAYCDARRDEESGAIRADIYAYLPQEAGMGIIAIPYLGEETYHLPPGFLKSIEITEQELHEYLQRYGGPVRLDGRMLWQADDLVNNVRSTDHSASPGGDNTNLGE